MIAMSETPSALFCFLFFFFEKNVVLVHKRYIFQPFDL